MTTLNTNASRVLRLWHAFVLWLAVAVATKLTTAAAAPFGGASSTKAKTTSRLDMSFLHRTKTESLTNVIKKVLIDHEDLLLEEIDLSASLPGGGGFGEEGSNNKQKSSNMKKLVETFLEYGNEGQTIQQLSIRQCKLIPDDATVLMDAMVKEPNITATSKLHKTGTDIAHEESLIQKDR